MSLEILIADTSEVVLCRGSVMREMTMTMIQAGMVMTRIHLMVMAVSWS